MDKISHKAVHDEVLNPEIREIVKMPLENLDTVQRNWRYVSDDNNIIVINRAESSSDKPKLTYIDLSQRYIVSPKNNDTEAALPKLSPLTSFPHLCESICAYAIKLTDQHGAAKHTASALIVKNIYNAIRFMYFISARGKYHLANITRIDLDAFLESSHSGWNSILNLNEKYNNLIMKVENNNILIENLVNITGNDLCISDNAIRNVFGFDIMTIKKPKSIYDFFIKKTGANEDKKNRGYTSEEDLHKSPISIESILATVNGLRELPNKVDRLSFMPFHDIAGTAKTVSLKSEGRTENISLEDTVRILNTSLKWMYDYSPFIFELLDKLKVKAIELNKQDHLTYTYRTESLGKYFRTLWNVSPLKELLIDLEVGALNVNKRKSSTSFKELLLTMQTSCFIVIAINNARRRNEIIGENKKYGLYYGCVKSHSDNILQHSSIDIYIEKTVEEYCTFWTNDLTVDAVELLEKLHLAFLPFGDTVELSSSSPARSIKLFQIKNINPDAFNNKFTPYVYSDHSKLFFKLSGVSKQALEGKSHPFRRIFSLIYHYRFKNQKIHSLSLHLRHDDYDMTRVYITDPAMRASAESIERLYKESTKENESMDSIDGQVRHEFSIELVADILNGDAAGGYTKRIRRLHNLLLNRTKNVNGSNKYKSLSREEQTNILVDSIERHDNKPNSRVHGVCWANNKNKGACQNKSTHKLDKHNATPELCVTCAYHQFSDEYLSNLEDDYITLFDSTKNYDIPKSQRLAAEKAASNLKKLIDIERNMIEKAVSV